MSNTKIKSSQFHGVVGHGTDGYFLITNGDGSMSWIASVVNPVISSLSYPGSATAADPAGGETITITGTGFKTGATVTVGGTAAPSVSYVSATSLTITTPAKAAGDYDVVVTNTDGGTATSVNGISFNGIPSWTTSAGTLGTFASDTTISTITLQASEPDAGTITFSITNGALPTGLSLTGADIDGTTTLETADTLYTFTVTATDDETQATPRTFTITVTKQFINTDNFTINTYTGNGSTQSIEGKIGTAADFNGSSSYIALPDNAFNFTTLTVSVWINVTTFNGEKWIFDGYDEIPGVGKGFAVTTHTGDKVKFRAWGTGFAEVISNTILSTNTWYNVTCVATQSEAKVYINGSLDNTGSLTGIQYAPTQNYGLGAVNVTGTPSGHFTGRIDQVRIFNKALSSTEVTTLYGESNTSTTKSTTDIFNDGSGVALYEFEEGAKDTGGVNGYIGGAASFNGSSSKIEVSSLPTDTSFSLSFWMKASDPNSDNVLFHFRNTSSHIAANTVGIANAGTQFGWFPHNSTGGAGLISISTSDTNDLFDDDWHHVVIVSDSSSFSNSKMYVDGSEKTLTINNSYTTSVKMEGTLYIGERADGNNNYNGLLDQVRIFNKALSSSEVTTLYGETSASATKSTTDIFSDSSGIALYELEGNANDTGKTPYGTGAIDSGQSAVFNGTALSANRMFSTASSYSISFWAKMASGTTTENCYFWQVSGTTQRALMVNYSGSGTNYTFTFNHKGATNSGTASAVTFVPDGNWHHFTGTFNSSTSTGSLYIDGAEKNTFTLDPVSDTGSTLYMGGNYVYNNVQYYVPLSGLDQIRIYDTALSASDVEALASETNVPTANLVAHYKLDGDATDETTNYDGTATSITYSDPAEFPLIVYNGTPTNVSYAYDGTPTNVNFLGMAFQPDLVWIKHRNQPYTHALHDSVRGIQKLLRTNTTNAEYSSSNPPAGTLTSFDSNGFTITEDATWTLNNSSTNYVAWCFKGGGAAVSNTDGSITSSVSANPDAGFSIVKYTGNFTASTVGHGLSAAPEMVIVKNRDSATNWWVWHTGLGDGTKYLKLNGTDAVNSASSIWNGTVPTSTVFSVANDGGSNGSGNDIIAYCFHSVDGYQKVGSYTADNQTTKNITTGFRPRFLLLKRTNSAQNWVLVDSLRSNNELYANTSGSEATEASIPTFYDDGFTLHNTRYNGGTDNYIYLAIA